MDIYNSFSVEFVGSLRANSCHLGLSVIYLLIPLVEQYKNYSSLEAI